MKIIYVKRIKWTHLLQLRRAGYTVILKAAAVACMYTMDCPVAQVCVVDVSGHGYCQAATYNSPDLSTLGQCTFNYDCGPGEACVKSTLKRYGHCTKTAD